MSTPRSDSQEHEGTSVPQRLSIVMEGDGETMGPMLKRAKIRDVWMYCDEGPSLGGDGSAPTPMEYFVASIVF